MQETAILTVKCIDGRLSWDEGPESFLRYGAGKQRAKTLLTVDMLTSCADHLITILQEKLSSDRDGWKRSLNTHAADMSLTSNQRSSKKAEVDKQILEIEGKLRALAVFDLDKYLYDIIRATLLADNEFGQLTYIVKRRITERKAQREHGALMSNWRMIGANTCLVEKDILAIRCSPRGADLMNSIWQHNRLEAMGLDQDWFLLSRTIPLVWLLDWIQHIDALDIDLGQSVAKASRKMAVWDQGMDDVLQTFHRTMIANACGLRGTMDSLELESVPKKDQWNLFIRDDFIASLLPSFNDYLKWENRVRKISSMDKAGIIVVGMGGSGKTTFLRRCFEIIKDDFGNHHLNEEIDPKSTAFVVGHLYKDIYVPVYGNVKKAMSLCWMDTAGAEDYRVLGQQLTISIKEMGKKIFAGESVDYSLIFVWSYESGYNSYRGLQNFENVFSRFMGEVENLGYFGYQPPNRVYLLLNKADIAERDGMLDQFKEDHERAFITILDKNPMSISGESLGLVSVLGSAHDMISDLLLVTISGISNADKRGAILGIRNGINQSIIGNLLTGEEASLFKKEVYDTCSGKDQRSYVQATIDWIEIFLTKSAANSKNATARTLLNSLKAFLIGVLPYA